MNLNQGKISVNDIKHIAKELGDPISEQEIHEMIEEADSDSKHCHSFSFVISP